MTLRHDGKLDEMSCSLVIDYCSWELCFLLCVSVCVSAGDVPGEPEAADAARRVSADALKSIQLPPWGSAFLLIESGFLQDVAAVSRASLCADFMLLCSSIFMRSSRPLRVEP